MLKKRAIIITGPGFEDSEFIYPYYRLLEEGVHVDSATSNDADVVGKHGYPMNPTIAVGDIREEDFDLVVIPGGHEAPDRVRQNKKILEFIKKMHEKGKLVASTCHGPWVLISAGIINGKQATCYSGMKDDLINAGALYEEAPVVIDKNIITSDHPRSLGPWMKATVALLYKSSK